jgi:hypothetical protein
MPQTSTQMEILKPVQDAVNSIPAPLKSPIGMLLLGGVALFAVVSMLSKSFRKRGPRDALARVKNKPMPSDRRNNSSVLANTTALHCIWDDGTS